VKRILAVVLPAVLSTVCLAAHAQGYPSKPVTIIVPFGPGGNADLAARSLAQSAQKYLGQSIVILNKAGAGGIVGSQAVVSAAPDGYTLLLARVGSQAVAPALDPATTYKWDSFTFIAGLELDPYICLVSAKSPVHTLSQLIDAVRAKPGKMTYASTGFADATVVFPVKIFKNAGLPADAALKVPYRNGSDTVPAVIGGQTDFVCNGFSLYVGGLNAGTLRGLVVSTRERIPEAPDVPSARELGMPDLEVVSGWSALYGPPGLPKDVVDKWVKVLDQVKRDPEWLAQVKKRLSVPNVTSPEEMRAFAESQAAVYRAMAPELAIK
jgi:tripartite-type tricarboxylate transporter receptor subunit TctC